MIKMIKVKYKIESIAPILFHNVNSMDLIKPKTMTHKEFEASKEMKDARLYLEEDKLTLPPRVILGTIKLAALKSGIKQTGKRAGYKNLVEAVVFCLEPAYLDQQYKEVQEHKEYVTVNNSKILRIFPALKKWSCVAELTLDEEQIPLEVTDALFEYAGNYLGFGDYSPQFGRFNAKRVK
jgi:hypothetical protein